LYFSEITTLLFSYSGFFLVTFEREFLGGLFRLWDADRWALVVAHGYLLVTRRQLSFGVSVF
jgi:hypothetical protein